MSDEERTVLRGRPLAGIALVHRLLGRDDRRTAIAFAYLGGVCLLFAVSHAASTVSIGGSRLETHSTAFDSLTALVIFVAVVTITLSPFVYAVANDGPVLSFAIPLVPVGLAEVASRRYVLGLDGAIALTTGAVAATFAFYVAGVRTAETIRPWRQRPIDEDALLVVTALVVVSSVTVVRFVAVGPVHVRGWYEPFLALWLVPAALVPTYWATWAYCVVLGRRDRRPAGA